MDAMLWFVLVVMGVAVAFFIFGDDMLQFLHKSDRIKKSTGNAHGNVRIDNRAVGTINKPTEIELMGVDKAKIVMRSIHAPFHETILILNRSQLKHDPFETLHTGRISYWITQDEFLQIESNENTSVQHPGNGIQPHEDYHPTLTKSELNQKSQDAFDKWKVAESEVTALKATMEQKVDERVDQAARLTSSAKERNIGKGR